jgi:hypothetical protein
MIFILAARQGQPPSIPGDDVLTFLPCGGHDPAHWVDRDVAGPNLKIEFSAGCVAAPERFTLPDYIALSMLKRPEPPIKRVEMFAMIDNRDASVAWHFTRKRNFSAVHSPDSGAGRNRKVDALAEDLKS